jgi:hypothetical protein
MDGGNLNINFKNFQTEYFDTGKDPNPAKIILTGNAVSTINCSGTATLASGTVVDASGVTVGGTYDLIDATTSLTDNGVVLDAVSRARGYTLVKAGNKLVLNILQGTMFLVH